MLRPKKFEIRNNVKESIKNQKESHKIEPNPPKDRAMHGGDNPLF
jgi:hypothetical protein